MIEVDAGQVPPSAKKYFVICLHAHKTLKIGDAVCMVETPRTRNNYLLRLSDMTLHQLADESDQYVHLKESTVSAN